MPSPSHAHHHGLLKPMEQDQQLIGWFDHQWLNTVPRSGFLRMMQVLSNVTTPAVRRSWLWCTLQPSRDVQYTVEFTKFKSNKDVMNVRVGSSFKAVGKKFQRGHLKMGYDHKMQGDKFNLSATITVLSVMKEDPRIPNAVRIHIDNKDFTLKSTCDGRIVILDATINSEALALLYEGKSTVPSGVGCIEVQGFHDLNTDVARMLALANLRAPLSYFLPQNASSATKAEAISAFVALLIAGILVILLISYGIYAAVTSGAANTRKK